MPLVNIQFTKDENKGYKYDTTELDYELFITFANTGADIKIYFKVNDDNKYFIEQIKTLNDENTLYINLAKIAKDFSDSYFNGGLLPLELTTCHEILNCISNRLDTDNPPT